MSLLQHLRVYHGDWMSKRNELNQLFASRPPLPFSVYPHEEDVVARLYIADTLVNNTYIFPEDGPDIIQMIDYYRESFGYQIKETFDYAIYFDTDSQIPYPAELIYFHELDEYADVLNSCFTIVV